MRHLAFKNRPDVLATLAFARNGQFLDTRVSQIGIGVCPSAIEHLHVATYNPPLATGCAIEKPLAINSINELDLLQAQVGTYFSHVAVATPLRLSGWI